MTASGHEATHPSKCMDNTGGSGHDIQHAPSWQFVHFEEDEHRGYGK